MTKWTSKQIPDLNGKIYLITGANSGLGFESAKVLLLKGARVIMACRNLEKGEEAIRKIRKEDSAIDTDLRKLDLSDLNDVKEFAAGIHKDYDRIDVLMNNAGIMATPFGKTRQGFEMQFGTNHLGHFALTGLLLDQLVNHSGSRVVNLSSIASRKGTIDFDNLMWEKNYNPMNAYRQSKLANLLFTLELQRRIDEHHAGMVAVAAHPGVSATNLHNAMQVNKTLISIYEALFMRFLPDASKGALSQLYAATSSDVKPGGYYGPGGPFEAWGYPSPATIPNRALDSETARKLWEVSEDLTGIKYRFGN